MKKITIIIFLSTLAILAAACLPSQPPKPQGLQVLAVESFLADIAQNVAGDRYTVQSLIPLGVDPHGFEPTPQDVARISDSDLVIINGSGFEEWLEEMLANSGSELNIISASDGLEIREPQPGEMHDEDDAEHEGHHHEGDPHFWLDPNLVIHYVENIRDGFIQADPDGADVYNQNATNYIARLQELDGWITDQVATIPVDNRLLVTNHESFGYFADRYGFRIIGTIIPSVSTGAAPSAQELADLVDHILASGAPAIFLETGSNPQLAEQVAAEAGIQVVTGLYTHSLSSPDGDAPTYIAMMRYNVNAIVAALK